MVVCLHVVGHRLHTEHHLVGEEGRRGEERRRGDEDPTFGLICANLSRTPETPKSGEVELQTAPGDGGDDEL